MTTPVMVKMSPSLAARIDAAAKAGESRPATIRRLVEERLDAAALGGLTAEEIETLRRVSAALNTE